MSKTKAFNVVSQIGAIRLFANEVYEITTAFKSITLDQPPRKAVDKMLNKIDTMKNIAKDL